MQHPVGTPDRVFFAEKNGEPARLGSGSSFWYVRNDFDK